MTLSAVEKEFSADASYLYIFFGGISAGISMPPFEFYNSSKILDENKLFIRDFGQCWYQNGLPEISTDIFSTATYLKSEIAAINPQKVFFVGNSMGGYAAILLALLVGQGEVIAFAPQTFICPDLRQRYQDRRWTKELQNTYKLSFFKRKILDIRPLLKPDNPVKISIFVAEDDQLDMIHAEHLQGLSGVHIYRFADGGHGIVVSLRDAGKFPAIMAGTYNESGD